MTDEDLIRAFFIYDFPRVFYAEQGQGSVKLITCNSLCICRLQRLKELLPIIVKEEGIKNIRKH